MERKIDEIRTNTRRIKRQIEELETTRRTLTYKLAEALREREIDWQTHSKLISLAQQLSEKIEDVNEILSRITSFSNVVQLAPLFGLEETIRSDEYIDLIDILRSLGFNLNVLFDKPLPSVSIPTTDEEEYKTKSIDNVLFSYTPFKLRGTEGNYSMLLLPSVRGDNLQGLSWCDEDAVTFYEDNIKILTPNIIKLVNLNELRDTIRINGEYGFRLEIDRMLPKRAFYCKMGYYITSKPSCNRRGCYLWQVCKGRRFWKGPKTYYSLVKVMPEIRVRIDSYESPRELRKIDNNLTIEVIDSLNAKVYIHSVIFLSSYLNYNPRISLKEAPGYKISTRAIALSFDRKFLEEFVKRVLQSNQDIFTWLFVKYFISSNFDVNDLRGLSEFFWRIITFQDNSRVRELERGLKKRIVTEDLVNFGISVLLHSLAHLLHNEIANALQTSPQNLIYAYSKEPEHYDGKYRIFIIENAERGLGLTQSYKAMITSKAEYFKELLNKLIDLMNRCSTTALKSDLQISMPNEVKRVWERIEEYNKIFQQRFGIFLPIEFTRYILSRYDPATRRILNRESVAPYMDDLLSAISPCWDGCYHCVRLEGGCHLSPYEQIFNVSKSLTLAFVNELIEKISRGQVDIEIGRARSIIGLLEKAEKSLTIISPWFSKEVAEDLCNLSREKGLNISILTYYDEKVDTHLQALKVFKSFLAQHKLQDQVKVFVLKDILPHLKMIIIDNKILIIGSANLTLSGLYGNIEGYAIIREKRIIEEALNQFNNLCRYGKNILNMDL